MLDRCCNPKNPAFYLYGEKKGGVVFVNGGMTSRTLLMTWAECLMGIHWNGMMSTETMNR
jgi:hypothetical protein